MASRLRSVILCNLCEKVYDPNRLLWVRVEDYRAYHGEPPDSYAFDEALCDACHTLYSAMIGRRITASVPDSTPLIDHGFA